MSRREIRYATKPFRVQVKKADNHDSWNCNDGDGCGENYAGVAIMSSQMDNCRQHNKQKDNKQGEGHVIPKMRTWFHSKHNGQLRIGFRHHRFGQRIADDSEFS
jgi:hypothetical protein